MNEALNYIIERNGNCGTLFCTECPIKEGCWGIVPFSIEDDDAKRLALAKEKLSDRP